MLQTIIIVIITIIITIPIITIIKVQCCCSSLSCLTGSYDF